jgi:hypothetical protein
MTRKFVFFCAFFVTLMLSSTILAQEHPQPITVFVAKKIITMDKGLEMRRRCLCEARLPRQHLPKFLVAPRAAGQNRISGDLRGESLTRIAG